MLKTFYELQTLFNKTTISFKDGLNVAWEATAWSDQVDGKLQLVICIVEPLVHLHLDNIAEIPIKRDRWWHVDGEMKIFGQPLFSYIDHVQKLSGAHIASFGPPTWFNRSITLMQVVGLILKLCGKHWRGMQWCSLFFTAKTIADDMSLVYLCGTINWIISLLGSVFQSTVC